MENAETIVFLYSASHVPDLIRDAAMKQVPSGFQLELCESATDAGTRRDRVAEADYLMLYGVGFDDVDVANRVRLLQILSAGYDRLDVPALTAKGIPLATNGGANAPTVAEHALMLMLAVYRKLPLHHGELVGGNWLGHREALRMFELRGKRVGIVGFGKIGREVARMVRGFLAEPVYADVMAADPDVERELGARRVELDELLATSDIVTLHTPLTDGSRGLMDATAFRAMKSSAVLINTSRGEIVVEDDLVEALRSGEIAGAGLDVFETEPLGTSPLAGMNTVVMTPHTAGTTIDTWWRRLDFAFGNIGRVSAGEAPGFVVNPDYASSSGQT